MNAIIKRQAKEKEALIEQFHKTPIIQLACEKTGIARATYYRWKNEDQDFSKKVEEALNEGLMFINDVAESQLISAIKDKNFGAISYWLNHRHPAYTTRIEIAGHVPSNETLTPEQNALIDKALKLARCITIGKGEGNG